jgi:hypothetical protein
MGNLSDNDLTSTNPETTLLFASDANLYSQIMSFRLACFVSILLSSGYLCQKIDVQAKDNLGSAELEEERIEKHRQLKDKFDAIHSHFEDKESVQLCTALSGKSDIDRLGREFKKQEKWISLEKEKQALVDCF